MGGPIQPTLGAEERETNWRAIGIAIAVVVGIVVILFLTSRTGQKPPANPTLTPRTSSFRT